MRSTPTSGRYPSTPYLALPAPPWSFTEYARRVTYGASTRFEQAVAIEYAVREGRRHDPEAPAGSSYARLESFLFREPGSEPGAGAGTSEQFATAFAVLARAVGLPTRVVVGFAPGGPAGDGGRVVRGVDAVAWPEVYFDEVGWYAFDLSLLGNRPAPGQPAPVIAAGLAALAPAPGPATHPALVIAAAADRAAFAPADRAGGPGGQPGWRALPELRRAVRAAVPLRRRVTWPVDPRPLLRRR